MSTIKTQEHTLRVCYFGTYRQEYSRNQIMIEGLRQAGVDVIECHEPLWRGIEDRVQAASGGWLRPKFAWRVLRAYWHLLGRYWQVADYDILVVGYPGQVDVFLARLLTWLRRKPLVWDIFMSIYLVAIERELDKRSRFTISMLRGLEWMACRLPDRLILDTPDYVVWFGKTYGITNKRFRLVPTGADERIFHPILYQKRDSHTFHVIYYGTFIPNHGVGHIVEAALILADDPSIQFEFIGDGPDRKKAQEIANYNHLSNITFVEWLEKAELVQHLAKADVILGAFGISQQSLMTVQNKIYEGMAMAKPVITGKSPAIRQVFTPSEQVYLCERENSISLAHAIKTLQGDPELRNNLGKNGFYSFCDRFDLCHIGKIFLSHLNELIT